jgi:hypothetical protein
MPVVLQGVLTLRGYYAWCQVSSPDTGVKITKSTIYVKPFFANIERFPLTCQSKLCIFGSATIQFPGLTEGQKHERIRCLNEERR